MISCLGNIQKLHHFAVLFFGPFLKMREGKIVLVTTTQGSLVIFRVMGEHHEFSKNRLISWQAPQVTTFVCY